MAQSTNLVFHVLFFISLVVPNVAACDDPSKVATVEQKVGISQIVIQGTVISHYPVNLTPELFTAEVEVHCVFKDQGRRIPQFVNISRAGSEFGKCFMNELKIAEEYVIFLRNLSAKFETPEKEFSVKNSQAYKDLQTACGMSIVNKYPQGITEKNSPKKCPDIKGHDCPPSKNVIVKERTKRPPNNKGLLQRERTTNLIGTVTDSDSAVVQIHACHGVFVMSLIFYKSLV